MEYQENYSVSAFVDYLQTELCWSSSGRKHHHFRWLFWSPENQQHLDLSTSNIQEPIIKQKIKLAIQELIESYIDYCLVQFWAPETRGGRVFLTSSEQPFAVDWLCKGLCWYRKHCCSHTYFVDSNAKEDELGPPGRVFRSGLPESSPDLRLYSGKEHPLRNQALSCSIRGYMALPVFEMHGQACVGVLEFVVFSAGYINIINEVEEGLKIADLRWGNQLLAPPTASHLHNENEDEETGRQQAGLNEIDKMFDLLKTSPQLFLAQAWITSKQSPKPNDSTTPGTTTIFFEQAKHKVFVEDEEHYNSSTTHFLKATKLHPLILGNGIAGALLSTYESFFCPNISNFSISNFPLVHYARLARLTASFSICLQSRDEIYVLQFFLLPDAEYSARSFLPFLMAVMGECLLSFKFLSGKLFGEELLVKAIEFSRVSNDFLELESYPLRFETWRYEEGLERVREAFQQLRFGCEAMEISVEQNNVDTKLEKGVISTRAAREKQKKIRICYEDLEAYFGKTLRDAEKGLGVSRSTLKRACREHNITRWPSNERNKANPSLFRNKNFHARHNISTSDFDFMIIEADFKGDTIKFKLPFSSGMEKLEEEIGRRLKLNVNSFRVKYMDEDGKWILLTCDDDLEFCEERLASSEGNLVKMLVQL